jgi:hypothetical protein
MGFAGISWILWIINSTSARHFENKYCKLRTIAALQCGAQYPIFALNHLKKQKNYDTCKRIRGAIAHH